MEGRETEEDENETHKLRRSDSGERCILNTVLLHLARSWFPPDVEAVGGGMINLDVPGWSTRNCGVEQHRKHYKQLVLEATKTISRS